MEEVKEHQITPVRFSMINPQSPGGKRAPFSDDTFAIPSVVVPKKRQRTKKRQGICTAKTPCYLRVLILISIYPIFYYQKEIKEMLLLAPGTFVRVDILFS